jgi:hypothetical protein
MSEDFQQSISERKGLLRSVTSFFTWPSIVTVEHTAKLLTRGSTSEAHIVLNGWGTLTMLAAEHPSWSLREEVPLSALAYSNKVELQVKLPKGAQVRFTYSNLFGRSRFEYQMPTIPPELHPVPSHPVGRSYWIDKDLIARGNIRRDKVCPLIASSFRSMAQSIRFICLSAPRPLILNFFEASSQFISTKVPNDFSLSSKYLFRPLRQATALQQFLPSITITEEY